MPLPVATPGSGLRCSAAACSRGAGWFWRFPLVEARIDRERYLVSMLGEECNWVRNVRAAGGVVKLRHGGVESVQLVEVPVEQRACVIKKYVERAPGARPHIPVDRRADVSVFETIAARYPVFRITTEKQQI